MSMDFAAYFDRMVRGHKMDNVIVGGMVKDLHRWYKGDHVSDVDDGAILTTWEDFSPIHRNAVPFAEGNEPIYHDGEDGLFNGKPYVSFDGLTQRLTAPPLTGIRGYEIFIVGRFYTKAQAPSALGMIISNHPAAGVTKGGFSLGLDNRGNPAQNSFLVTTCVGQTGAFTKDLRVAYKNNSYVSGTPAIINSSYQYAKDYYVVNGIDQAEYGRNGYAGSGSYVESASAMTIGGSGAAALSQRMDVAEVIVFGRRLRKIERTLVTTYLMNEYDLAP